MHALSPDSWAGLTKRERGKKLVSLLRRVRDAYLGVRASGLACIDGFFDETRGWRHFLNLWEEEEEREEGRQGLTLGSVELLKPYFQWARWLLLVEKLQQFCQTKAFISGRKKRESLLPLNRTRGRSLTPLRCPYPTLIKSLLRKKTPIGSFFKILFGML